MTSAAASALAPCSERAQRARWRLLAFVLSRYKGAMRRSTRLASAAAAAGAAGAAAGESPCADAGPSAEVAGEGALCRVCWAAPRRTVFTACGHHLLCEPCTAELLRRGRGAAACPLCRASVADDGGWRLADPPAGLGAAPSYQPDAVVPGQAEHAAQEARNRLLASLAALHDDAGDVGGAEEAAAPVADLAWRATPMGRDYLARLRGGDGDLEPLRRLGVMRAPPGLMARLNTTFDEADAAALGEALAANTTLAVLDLEHADLSGSARVAPIAAALRANTALATLVMAGTALDDVGAAALGDALRANATLRRVTLGDNALGAAGAAAVAEALKVNRSVTALHMCGNEGLGNAGAAALAEALHVNATLRLLHLGGCRVGAAGAAALGGALRANVTLTLLNLDDCGVGPAGAAALAEGVCVNGALRALHLEGNGVGAEGGAALGRSLARNRTLHTLSLGGNRLGNAGAAALADGLRANSALKELWLGSYGACNGIGDAGAAALGAALAVNATLVALSMFDGGVGAAGAAALADGVRRNAALETMNITGGFGAEGEAALRAAWAACPAAAVAGYRRLLVRGSLPRTVATARRSTPHERWWNGDPAADEADDG